MTDRERKWLCGTCGDHFENKEAHPKEDCLSNCKRLLAWHEKEVVMWSQKVEALND